MSSGAQKYLMVTLVVINQAQFQWVAVLGTSAVGLYLLQLLVSLDVTKAPFEVF